MLKHLVPYLQLAHRYHIQRHVQAPPSSSALVLAQLPLQRLANANQQISGVAAASKPINGARQWVLPDAECVVHNGPFVQKLRLKLHGTSSSSHPSAAAVHSSDKRVVCALGLGSAPASRWNPHSVYVPLLLFTFLRRLLNAYMRI